MKNQVVDIGANPDPIFIHSLFRAGSTYIFNAFRRSSSGYWCYQEPLHEVALFARGAPESLLTFHGEQVKHLRHPEMEASYFRELYDVSSSCLDKLSKDAIYDGYFGHGCDLGLEYWSALIAEAKGRPVIQECRTSSRIGAIKKSLGGFHIFLWRNPFDQWWSYKVTDYFDATSQLFLNAAGGPPVIERLRDEIAFVGFDSTDLAQQIEWFVKRRLEPEKSYLIFYVLWLLALREALTHADLLLNVDRLSDSAEYRSEVLGTLSLRGIDGVDFSDAAIPQALYGADERSYFERIEDRAHGLLLLSGISQRELSSLLDLRSAAEPSAWHNPAESANFSNLVRDAERARSLVSRIEQRELLSVSEAQGAAEQARARLMEAEKLVSEVEARTKAAEARATEAETRATEAETRATEAETRATEAETRATEAETRATEAETRAAEAETRATEAETRAIQIEARVVESEWRADQAESRATVAESRASQAELSAHQAQAAACEARLQYQAINFSRSWRITAPLRWGALYANWFVRGSGAWLKLRPGSRPRRAARQLLIVLQDRVLRNPALKTKALRVLAHFPRVRGWLRSFYYATAAQGPLSQSSGGGKATETVRADAARARDLLSDGSVLRRTIEVAGKTPEDVLSTLEYEIKTSSEATCLRRLEATK